MDSENNYTKYLKLGGIINEKDYTSAIERAKNPNALNTKCPAVQNAILHAEIIARCSGIELEKSNKATNPIIVLYVILRLDKAPEDTRHHHSQMSDQKIFAEALRMLENVEYLEKIIKANPHISFKYERAKAD